MKALLCKKYGPPESLVVEEVTSLHPEKDQVVISVKACGVNFPDTLIIQGKYQFKPSFPFSPGGEVAGIVKEIGEDVKHLQVGDNVFAMPGWGGFAEELLVKANRTFKMPPNMDYAVAASLMYTYGTSYHALKDRAQLKAGEILLVLGAAGGVGLAAVNLGKIMGATVIAAASSDEKLALCKEYGADGLINYSKEDLRESLKTLTGGGVDVIYDPVGGEYAEPAFRAMNWKGRYLVVGFAAVAYRSVLESILFCFLLVTGAAPLPSNTRQNGEVFGLSPSSAEGPPAPSTTCHPNSARIREVALRFSGASDNLRRVRAPSRTPVCVNSATAAK